MAQLWFFSFPKPIGHGPGQWVGEGKVKEPPVIDQGDKTVGADEMTESRLLTPWHILALNTLLLRDSVSQRLQRELTVSCASIPSLAPGCTPQRREKYTRWAAFRDLTDLMRKMSTRNRGLDFVTRITSVKREREL